MRSNPRRGWRLRLGLVNGLLWPGALLAQLPALIPIGEAARTEAGALTRLERLIAFDSEPAVGIDAGRGQVVTVTKKGRRLTLSNPQLEPVPLGAVAISRDSLGRLYVLDQ